MKISALIVTYNEEKRLEQCLNSIIRFDELAVVDLGSQDHSVEIARNMGIKVIPHPWVPFGELVLPSLMPTMKNDWIIRVDPDEVLPSELMEDLIKLDLTEEYGMICVPYQFYFLNSKLDTTIWGGVRHIPRLLNRKKSVVEPDVHRTYRCKPGFETYYLPIKSDNAVQHYWVDSYSQLFSKHGRYIALEGKSRYNNGMKFRWKTCLISTIRGFLRSFIKYSGWRGGWSGWFLSWFYGLYEFRAWLSLRRYEKGLSK